MKTVEEFRNYFVQAPAVELRHLLWKIYVAQGAAYTDHILSPRLDEELRAALSEIAGITEADKKDLAGIGRKYCEEIQSLTKDKKPYAVPFQERKKTLSKLLIFGGTAAAAAIGFGIWATQSGKKNRDKENHERK